MMQYLMIIAHDEHFNPTESLISDIGAWIQAMQDRGIRIHGNPLRPPNDATTVRVRGDDLVVTSGPFADSDERICAYELIECADLEEATMIASQHPMAKAATNEVRPIWTGLT